MAHASEIDLGLGKKKLGIYSIGIVLCVILTLIPFYVVMHSTFSVRNNFFVIWGAAIVQFLVQVYCFVRLNTKTPQSKLNTMAFLFTIMILLVVIGGSLWIMWNLDYNMMM